LWREQRNEERYSVLRASMMHEHCAYHSLIGRIETSLRSSSHDAQNPLVRGIKRSLRSENNFDADTQLLTVAPSAGRHILTLDIVPPKGTHFAAPADDWPVIRQARGTVVELSVMGGELAQKEVGSSLARFGFHFLS
jgi:hypothetical protein